MNCYKTATKNLSSLMHISQTFHIENKSVNFLRNENTNFLVVFGCFYQLENEVTNTRTKGVIFIDVD